MKIGTLNVLVRPVQIRTAGPNGRRKTMTEVIIRMGGVPVADRTIPGVWDAAAALAEFKRFSSRFNPRTASGMTPELLKAFAA